MQPQSLEGGKDCRGHCQAEEETYDREAEGHSEQEESGGDVATIAE